MNDDTRLDMSDVPAHGPVNRMTAREILETYLYHGPTDAIDARRAGGKIEEALTEVKRELKNILEYSGMCQNPPLHMQNRFDFNDQETCGFIKRALALMRAVESES